MSSSLLCPIPGCAVPGIHADTCHDSDCLGCIPGRVDAPARVCRHHERRTTRLLSELPALYAAMGASMTGRTGSGSSARIGSGGGKPSPGLNLSAPVFDTRRVLLSNLRKVVGYVCEERQVQPPVILDEPRVLIAWLRGHLFWLLCSEMAETTVAMAEAQHRDARRFAYPRRPRGVLLGQCPYLPVGEAEGVCGGDVRFDPSEYAGEQVAACVRCGIAQPVDEWREVIRPQTLGVADAATVITVVAVETGEQITGEVLRQWKARGHVASGGMRGAAALYDLGSVLAHVRKKQRARCEAALTRILTESPPERRVGDALRVMPKPAPDLAAVIAAVQGEDPLAALLALCYPDEQQAEPEAVSA